MSKFSIFLVLSSLTTITGQPNFLNLGDGLTDRISETKIFLDFFTAKLETFAFNFALFSFFLYDLFTNKARKLDVPESNPIMENGLLFLTLSLGIAFLLLFMVSLSLALSLSLYDVARQLLCGVIIVVIVEMFFIIDDITGTF